MSIWHDILDWFHRIPAEIRKYVSHAIGAAKAIDDFMKSDLAKALTDFFPGDWDEQLRQEIIKGIAAVMPYLTIVDKCKDAETTEAMIQCWLTEVKTYPEAMQHALLHKLASLLTAYFDSNKRKESQYDYAVQKVFLEKFNR